MCVCVCVCSHVFWPRYYFIFVALMNRISAVSGAAVYYWRAISLFSSLMLKTGAEILVHFNHRNPALGKLLIQHVGNRRGASHETRPRKEKKKRKTYIPSQLLFFFLQQRWRWNTVNMPPLSRTDSPPQCCVIWSGKTKAVFIKPKVASSCIVYLSSG